MGLGGSLRAQPEIEAVFLPAGFRVVRIPVPYHDNPLALFGRLATLTFADLCLWIHEGAERLIRTAQLFAPEEYAVVGDSLGGFISVVAAQHDSRISHCVLLACSGDICDAASRLHRLNRVLALVVGRFAPGDSEDLKTAARKAASGESSSQREFELVDTINPGSAVVPAKFAHPGRQERPGGSGSRMPALRTKGQERNGTDGLR